ncbi:MAG: flagellar hook-basal body complex protein [Thermodesulfobacteriota bacterium]
MGLSNSLYASISGLSTMGNAMSVLGDNVANVNTIAFKSSRATFQDVLSQSLATAAGSAQVGRGVTLSTVDGLFAQGSFETTSTPTDLAIGGDGFFMLRAAGSAQADMYTRAGEFRFNTEGNLISPAGAFVQGWTINSTSGEIEGTIGDILLGKSTPPVATTQIDIIVNVDSRKNNETNESRLYEAWDGRNTAAAVPTDPIAAAAYEYTSAIKIYDSKGAAHDISIYFDRTTLDNQWEFLITCEPSEDHRTLNDGLDTAGNLDGTNDELSIYAPDTTFNYANHKGAGALLYGVIDFSVSGEIDRMWAWRVPPDGKVDPASNENRLVLGTTDQYYSFESNFTGATVNQAIALNFGARYSGQSTDITQILVSDDGARSTSGGANFITKETLWSSVYDSAGVQVTSGDSFYFAGYDNDGTAVSGIYTVDTTDKVQALLTALDSTFGCTATIDAQGRIRMTDKTGGASGMYVTDFTLVSANNATPFGGGALVGNHARISGGGTNNFFTTDGTTPATSASALLNTLRDDSNVLIVNGDQFQFTGTDVTGAAATANFTVGAASTVQDLLNFLEDLYDNAAVDSSYLTNNTVTATLGSDGRIRIVDNTGGTGMGITLTATVGGASRPLGANASVFAAQTIYATQVNVSSSKQQVVSQGRAVTTATGNEPVITASTDWANVYDTTGSGDAVANGDTFTFTGQRGDGTAVSATFTVGTNYGPPLTAVSGSVVDLLSWLEDQFDAEAAIDGAGRLVLSDRRADEAATGGYTSSLAISAVAYGAGTPNLFGTATFDTIVSDGASEDGSRQGDTVSIEFTTEALASTQYANSSTTIFQDQDGFAAGFLQSVAVDTGGIITGNYSNGQVLKKAQVALASFNNTQGLRKEGGNIFRETTESGAPVTGAPGTNGLGSIAPNSLEQSNVDLGTEFVKLITTQRGFQANSKVITTTDEMLNDLINIKR